MASPADIAREYLEAFNKRDFDKVRNIVHPEYTYTGGDGQEQAGGPDLAVSVMQMYATGFPDARLQIRAQYVQGNTAVTEFSYTATHTGDFMGIAPTGKRAQGPVVNIVDIRDGKIYREREVMDMMHMMTQLGVVEAPAGVPAG